MIGVRRKSIGFGLLAILFVCASIFLGWRFLHTDAPLLLQTITADMGHERVVSWKTNSGGGFGFLELRSAEADENAVWRIEAEQRALPVYQNRQETIYTARLTNLQEDTRYFYRIFAEGQYSNWHTFKTAARDSTFKAIIFGDSQSADYGIWARTAQRAWLSHEDASFFINMGDLVDNGQDSVQWNGWLKGVQMLAVSVPAAPVMGNHETYGVDWQVVEPEYFLSLFAVPENGPPDLARYAYSFDYGNVHFAVLNTQANELGDWHLDMLERQKNWLAVDLAKTGKPWKIVLMHRGVWESRFNARLNELGQLFVPTFERFHVDVVFTAHVHSYSRTKKLKNALPDSTGVMYISTGRSGSRVWEKSPQKQIDDVFYNPVVKPNYLVLEATRAALVITAFQQDGSVIDRVEIEK